MRSTIVSFSISIPFVLVSFSSQACSMTMGYRTNERPPLIAASPDNSGLYKHLYEKAAEKIGCKLNVVRGPKKRILKQLKNGTIDFYPGFNFSEARSQYIYFIENGLSGGEMGISLDDYPDIHHLADLKGSTVLQSLGSPNHVRHLNSVHTYVEPDMTIDRAVKLLKKKRGDFYIYNRASLHYYMKLKQPTGIKLHPNCCGTPRPLYLGFSRHSPYIKEEPNPQFQKDLKPSPDNQATQLNKESKAYLLQQALMKMKLSGETDAIYEMYYQ
ncbi:substrate-binding periplasmic protein [Vibrio nereis]|uniref:Amino acid ABC transporter n=1 Tax=Vibrio nereis TaxID=693 RepID=A0A0M0HM32_VIBNE|nr:transporter substrate-binding domain-containing protein [Vibrio nereis]KOO02828.1 amino acid ABC transporter [Vibrio nereis]